MPSIAHCASLRLGSIALCVGESWGCMAGVRGGLGWDPAAAWQPEHHRPHRQGSFSQRLRCAGALIPCSAACTLCISSSVVADCLIFHLERRCKEREL